MIIEAAKFPNGIFFILIVRNIPINEVRILVLDTIGVFHSHAVSFSVHQCESRTEIGVKIMIPEAAVNSTGFGRTISELVKLEGMF